MKDDFIKLVDQIIELEKLFHYTPPEPGFAVSYEAEISDVPEFQMWLPAVQMELQGIVDTTNDKYAQTVLASSQQMFGGWLDKSNFAKLKGMLFAMKGNIDKYYPSESTPRVINNKAPKIFISHATDDKDYVKLIVGLLEFMGLDQDHIFCSSYPGYDVPIDTDILDFIWNQYAHFNLHVLFVHSHKYYQRPICLNEMGAAWILKSTYSSLLLPGFHFNEMTGVVNDSKIAIRLDGDLKEVQDKLDQLYEKIASEFGLKKRSSTTWSTRRDEFIQEINAIKPTEKDAEQQKDKIKFLENGMCLKLSEVNKGNPIYYCTSCYRKTGRLFPAVKGSMARDRFCTNCRMRFDPPKDSLTVVSEEDYSE